MVEINRKIQRVELSIRSARKIPPLDSDRVLLPVGPGKVPIFASYRGFDFPKFMTTRPNVGVRLNLLSLT